MCIDYYFLCILILSYVEHDKMNTMAKPISIDLNFELDKLVMHLKHQVKM